MNPTSSLGVRFLTGNPREGPPGYDPLATVIEEGKNATDCVAIHAWINPYRGRGPMPSNALRQVIMKFTRSGNCGATGKAPRFGWIPGDARRFGQTYCSRNQRFGEPLLGRRP